MSFVAGCTVPACVWFAGAQDLEAARFHAREHAELHHHRVEIVETRARSVEYVETPSVRTQ